MRTAAMGLLDTLTSMTNSLNPENGAAAQQGGNLLPVLLEQLSRYPGGLPGLIKAFQEGGLGEVVQSWVGTGQNMPVSADQLDGVLPTGAVDAMAEQSGQNRGDVLAQLSQMLPHIVDRATPGGEVQQEQGFDAGSLIGMLSSLSR
jgi:uncharacterized protein YidB (DUF937 family)